MPVSSAPSVWGIHDLVPDYKAFSSLKEFTEADHSIKGGPSGCGWYRIVMPLAELGRHGWKTRWAAGTPVEQVRDYRIVTAQRMDKHEALPAWRRMRAQHRLVYEIDDDVFSVPAVNTMAHHVYERGDTRDAVIHAAQVADIVTVTTEPLAQVIRTHTGHTDVRVVPNMIPAALLTLDRQRDRRHVIVGWAGGASHGEDVAMIAAPVREFLDRQRNARMHLVGTNYEPTIGRRCRYTPWVPADASLGYYQGLGFDIGLCPLTGTVFDQSKSHIKALEYMALGIPVLASDVEPYRGLVIDGVNGWLIRKHGDWLRRLRDLAADPQAREEMGVKARETARAHTIEQGWRQWAAVYEELL